MFLCFGCGISWADKALTAECKPGHPSVKEDSSFYVIVRRSRELGIALVMNTAGFCQAYPQAAPDAAHARSVSVTGLENSRLSDQPVAEVTQSRSLIIVATS